MHGNTINKAVHPEVRKLIAQEEFQIDVETIRKKFEINLLEDKDEYYLEHYEKTYEDFFSSVLESSEFNDAVLSILKKHKLHRGWTEFIEMYILTDDKWNDPKRITTAYHLSEDMPPEHVITIHTPEATLHELKEIGEKICTTGVKGSRKKIWKTLERDQMIFRLRREGKSYKEIGNIVYNKYKEVLTAYNLKEIISNFREKMAIK